MENKSVTTSENIESELADHYHITRMYSPPAYLADWIATTLQQQQGSHESTVAEACSRLDRQLQLRWVGNNWAALPLLPFILLLFWPAVQDCGPFYGQNAAPAQKNS